MKELISLIGYFFYFFFLTLLTQNEFINNPHILNYPLLNFIILYKEIFFVLFPLLGSKLISDTSFKLDIIKPYRDLIYTIGSSIVVTITYVLLLNAPHLTWALAIAITSGITIFLLNLRRPDLLFPNEEEYLLNYEIIKNVIIVSTILLLITTIFSSNIFDITNPYLDHPLGILLLQLIQFTVTIILFIEIIVLLIIFRDREYALRLSIGHIKSIFNNEELSDDNISKSIISSLNFYNKYLQRTFGVTIVPIERLYEYVLFSSIINKAVLLSIFESQFRIGKLELLKYLRLFLAGEENNQRSQFLSGKNKMKPFIELSAIIIPILAVLVSVIDLLFK